MVLIRGKNRDLHLGMIFSVLVVVRLVGARSLLFSFLLPNIWSIIIGTIGRNQKVNVGVELLIVERLLLNLTRTAATTSSSRLGSIRGYHASSYTEYCVVLLLGRLMPPMSLGMLTKLMLVYQIFLLI